MVFEHVEKLKQEYTDKYVVVDEAAPELRRFKGMTGTVRTVNMSGRALVEFDAFNNIGWYDIDVDFLKVVDKPVEPEPPAAKAKPKVAKAEKGPSDLEKARSEKSKAGGGAKMSVADMLAAARGKKTDDKPAEAPAEKQPAKAMSAADILAAARKNKPAAKADEPEAATEAKVEEPQAAAAAPAASKVDPKKMSVSDILAAARGNAAPAETEADAADEVEETVVADPEPEVVEEAPPEEASDEGGDDDAGTGEIKSKRDEITSVEGMIAYCRQVGGNM